MALILLVLLLALLLGGLGFAVHILWWIALIVLIIWVLGFLVRAGEGGSRSRWYRWLPAAGPDPRRAGRRALGRGGPLLSSPSGTGTMSECRCAREPGDDRAVVGCSRRRGHAHPLRPLGPPGADLPLRTGPGLGPREQRHGGRGARPDRRGAAEAL